MIEKLDFGSFMKIYEPVGIGTKRENVTVTLFVFDASLDVYATWSEETVVTEKLLAPLMVLTARTP